MTSVQEELVDLLDDQGNVVDTKPYKEADRVRDTLHCVQIVFIDVQQQIYLNRLPAKSAWEGRLGPTASTIVRHGEATVVAAMRCLRKELGIDHARLQYLGESFEVMEGNVKRLLSQYLVVWNKSLVLNEDDGELVVMPKAAFLAGVQADRSQFFSPSFLVLWHRYATQFPW